MKILIACEESQAVCIEMRRLGHEAYSCDIQEPSGGHPEWHILGDALEAVKGGTIITMDGIAHEVGKWDMLLAHPPCTYLTKAGAVRMRKNGKIVPARFVKAMEAKAFFLEFWRADIPKIAIENPTPMQIVQLPPYTQAIQPYEYGHPYSKRTCLWLKNLPPLAPTKIIEEHRPWINGGCKDAHGNYRRYRGKESNPKVRSKTFLGIAKAMAEQWAGKMEAGDNATPDN